MAHDIALAITCLGVAVTVASSIAAVTMRSALDRMHFVTPITSLGCPLVAIGLSIEQGWGLTTASILFVTGLLFLAGPVLEAETGRLLGQIEGDVSSSGEEMD